MRTVVYATCWGLQMYTHSETGLSWYSPEFWFLAASLITICLRTLDPSYHRVRYLLFLEFFCVQIIGYHYHRMMILEFFFLPLIMVDIGIMFPSKAALPINLICGFVFIPFMSSSFQANATVTAFTLTFPLNHVILLYSTVCIFTCSLLSVLIQRLRQMQSAHDTEITINRNLDSINRTLSSKMFAIRSESEMQAKKEVTKKVHDNVGYIFTNLIMMLQATEAVFMHEPERTKAMLGNCVEYGCQGMNTIREALRSMRQTEEQPNMLIQKEIHALACLFSRCTGTTVKIEFGNWPKSFTPAINSFLLSFVKESLTNALKHGMATNIQIICGISEKKISITVQDNGSGLSDKTIHYGIGLQSIAEAAAQLGGKMKVIAQNEGFWIRVQLPIQ